MRRGLTRGAWILGIAVAAAACFRADDPIEVDETAIHVHAVLQAGADTATVVITRPGSYETFDYVLVPVTGASVRLIRGADTTELLPRADGGCVTFGRTPLGNGDGCYDATFAAPIQVGEEWELDITLADGVRITGATRVPTAPTITAPAAGEEFTVRCQGEYDCIPMWDPFVEPPQRAALGLIPMGWIKPAGADYIQFGLDVRRVAGAASNTICQFYPEPLYDPFQTSRDTLSWPIYGLDCHQRGTRLVQPWDSMFVDVVVSTASEEYSEYERAVFSGQSVRFDAVRAGVEGAYGVFGAMASARQPVVLINAKVGF